MMTASHPTPALPELVDTALGCQVYDTQWRPAHASGGLAVAADGKDLRAELAHWQTGQTRSIPAQAGEEMGAVLQGRFELRCGDETHVLEAGSGLLIPPGHEHRWTALQAGVLYRVTCPPKA